MVAAIASCAAACTALAGLEPLEFVDGADARAGETGSSEASSEADASVGDARAADATAFKGCAVIDAELCDDFEHGEAFAVRWSSLATQGMATVALSSEFARSGQFSVRAESLDDDAGPIDVMLQKLLPAFKGDFYVAFDVYFRVAPSKGVFIFQTTLTPTFGNQNDAVNPMIAAFDVGDGGVEVSAFNLMFNAIGRPLGIVQLNTWHRLEARVRRDADAATTTEQFQLEGYPLVTKQVPTEAPGPSPSARIGLNSGGTITEVFFDNVVIDSR